MQGLLDFLSADVLRWRGLLAPLLDPGDLSVRRTPLDQLVKSIISARTLDAVSAAAFARLKAAYPDPAMLAAAAPAAIEALIADVTFPDVKAARITGTLVMIHARRNGFDLSFLAAMPLDDALAWLEGLPGVARKVAASTLNASTFGRPVLIVDTHVLRVLARLGAVRPAATMQDASEAVTAAMPGWDGDAFLSFHVMLKRLGQRVCRPARPLCTACPLMGDCPAARRARATSTEPHGVP